MSNTSTGRFVWHELMTKDPKAAVDFYSETIGWKTEPFGSDYTMWVGSQGPLGGVMVLPAEAAKMGAPPHWIGSVQVNDVDASAAAAKKAGGKIYKEPMDIPTVGRYAVLADPQGAVIAIFKPSQEMKLHDVNVEGEFCWNELYTSDPPAALAFYTSLFGWKTLSEMDMGPMGIYTLFGVDEKQMGGVMKTPPGMQMPPSWVYYTETKDLDAAVQRATKRGAKLLNSMDVPGGRIAQLIDPQGAAFAMHQQKK